MVGHSCTIVNNERDAEVTSQHAHQEILLVRRADTFLAFEALNLAAFDDHELPVVQE